MAMAAAISIGIGIGVASTKRPFAIRPPHLIYYVARVHKSSLLLLLLTPL